tara:strand:+ start:317 stop:949 length:633 start_codon:yes stop_codon:yes gene_type:complete
VAEDLSQLSQPIARLVQIGLRELSFYDGTTKGFPGPKTKAAYAKYLSSLRKDAALAEHIALTAESQVGVEEEGMNGGKEVRTYQQATWYAPGPWPWCAAFVCWCVRAAAAIYESEGKKWSHNRPTTPGAFKFEQWAKKENITLIKPVDAPAKRGDIVVFKFSHIGIVVKDQEGSTLHTVEGNTNPAGGREGDGVYAKNRKIKHVRSLIRV